MVVKLAEEVRVVDADTHMTEAKDLWTKRAPRGYEDRLARVVEVDGRPTWVIDGKPFGFAGGGSTIDPEGVKHPFVESQVVWQREQSHPAAYDPEARLALMDQAGIYARVIYPNSIGLGGQNLSSSVDDQPLKLLCVRIYNDAMAELQDWSKHRFLPMPIMPARSVDDCVRSHCLDADDAVVRLADLDRLLMDASPSFEVVARPSKGNVGPGPDWLVSHVSPRKP